MPAVTNPTQVEAFETWVQHSGPAVSASSARVYAGAVRDFLLLHSDPLALTPEAIARWRNGIENVTRKGSVTRAAPTTVNCKIVAVRAFYDMLIEQGALKENPLRHLKLLSVPKRLPKPIEDDDCVKLIESIYARGDLQHIAIVETLIGSGLRRSELAHLQLGNVVDRELLQVFHGTKGEKERLVPMTDVQYRALRDWCLHAYGDARTAEVREQFDVDAAFADLRRRRPETYVFQSDAGTPLAELANPGNAVYRIWEKICEAAEVEVSPHQARHYFATNMLNNGADLQLISVALGHANIATTVGYTKVLRRGVRSLRGFHERQRQEA